MTKKAPAKKTPRAFGRVVQAESFTVQKKFLGDRMMLVGSVSNWGSSTFELYKWSEAFKRWDHVLKLDALDMRNAEKTLAMMRKLIKV